MGEQVKTETYICQHCDEAVTRNVARGQRPKWCPDCRAKAVWQRNNGACEACGADGVINGSRACSRLCGLYVRYGKWPASDVPDSHPSRPPRPPSDQRGPLRRAYEAGDYESVAAVIRADTIEVDGCWIWQRRMKDGYPVARLGSRELLVHRLMLEAKFGQPLGSQAAHHICAESQCVNPEHLQPVTHRENVAEMLARNSYLTRIRELEAALASADPAHPLLSVVAVA